ncbi:F0F1 ATP synthase subunit B [Mycoplasma flocculare]|uniref:ATP synthase subunit b n=2 Tax=Mesomycoplasma flocculare TaxID=2128 RepID=A0A0A8E6Q8_MESFC|nr:ATP synthase F0 subunit B [Mesomycoplasma flocculare]MXR39253.1 F0F1 ATP synthase subunit B [Mycoplasma sp. MF12]AJC49624.1 F0F1 ATP synthase subunit B [Mesomycoplasma flocculare ATCC 27399]ENX50837.1 ATP synthase subunit B [Mesomycoplasma flocculare ATCC 27716]MXR05667.1 F0F1 ATP synthase subunit B [Mesomycoplasma flocculare]MXR12037.1 F0F1 ATP synthase subunit B [Mesomycoplasma flocculare]
MVNLNQSLSDLFKGIIPNVYVISATIASFLILLLVIIYFVYRPLKKYIKMRKDFLQGHIDSTIKANEKAQKLENETQKKLIETKEFCKTLKEKSEIEANKFLENSKKTATEQTRQLINEGQKVLVEYEKEIVSKYQENVINVAFEISRKYLVNQEKNNKILHQKLLLDLQKELESQEKI